MPTRSINTNRRTASGAEYIVMGRRGEGIQGARQHSSRPSHVLQPGHCAPLRREDPRQLLVVPDVPGMTMSREGTPAGEPVSAGESS